MYHEAKRITREGGDPYEVWKQTGWFVGADGEWRFEIPDAEMELSAQVQFYAKYRF